MSKNIKTVPTKDFEDVVATVAKYVEGLRVGSVNGLVQAFHKDAVMYGLTNGELLGGPIKNLYDFVEKNGHRPRHQDAARRVGDHANDGSGARRHGEGRDRRQLHGLPHAHQNRWHLAHHSQGLSHV
jgi:hypothetical protein